MLLAESCLVLNTPSSGTPSPWEVPWQRLYLSSEFKETSPCPGHWRLGFLGSAILLSYSTQAALAGLYMNCEKEKQSGWVGEGYHFSGNIYLPFLFSCI